MPTLSIVFGFRDRDIQRVERCLFSLANQSYTDFDVVFVDYGSSLNIQNKVKKLIQKFSFVRYIFNNALGLVWNRSRALNSGANSSNSNYILFGDIDLLYHPEFLQVCIDSITTKSCISAPVLYLPEHFSNWDCLFTAPIAKFHSSHCPNGAVLLISRETYTKLNGFDEFFAFWGVEDRDFITRLESVEIEFIQINHKEYPVFHQWHPNASNLKENFFPSRWWEDMNIYYQQHIKKVKRNPNGMGYCYTTADRPIFKAVKKSFNIPARCDSYTLGAILCNLIQEIKNLASNECLEIIVPKEKLSSRIAYFLHYIKNLLLNRAYEAFLTREAVFYTFWQCIQKKIIIDYFIHQSSNVLHINVMNNKYNFSCQHP